MYNLYTSSATTTRRASLSFSFNDCPENCSSPFNGRCPSSSSCCCCCCCSCNCCSSLPTRTVVNNSPRLVPINPSPFYGFRQSTLIQLPLSRRRLILGAPIGDLGPTRSTSYGRFDCVRDTIRDEGMKSKQNGLGLWGYYSDACDDVDAMISLLSEGLREGDFGVPERRKKASLSKKGKVREGGVEERFVIREERVCLWDELENVGARGWKEGCRVKRWGKDFVKGEDSRLRKGGSIGSSYYSRMKWHEECVEDGLVGSEKESRKRVGVVAVNKQAKDELERQRIEKDECLESVRIDDEELKKKSKKKIRKELIEEAASGKKSVLNQSRLSEAHVSGSEMGSSMKKQNSYRVGKSISDVKSSFGRSRTDNRVSKTSDSRYKHESVTGNSGFVDKKTTSHSSELSGSEEHVVSASEICRTCGRVSSGSQAGSSNEQQSKFTQIQRNSAGFISSNEQQSRQEVSSSLIQKSAIEVNQQHKQEHLVASNQIDVRKSENYTERADAAESYEENTSISRRHAKHSEIENTDSRLTSTVRQQSGTRIKKQEGVSTLIQASLKQEDEKTHQTLLVATSQAELIRKSQKRIEIVDTGNSNVQYTSRTQQQQEARVKDSEENTVLISSQLSKGENYQTDIQVTTQKQSRKESKVLSGSSQVHFDETIVNSSSASEERSHSEQTYLTEKVKETREHVKETIKQTELRYEVQTPLREPSIVKESSRYPYVTSTSQVRIEEIGEEEDERNFPSGPSPSLAQPHVKETIKQTEVRYEVHMPVREPSIVKKETGRYPYVTSTSQVRIEEIGEEEDERNLPSGPSPRLAQPPQSIEVHPVSIEVHPVSIEVHPVSIESASRFSSQDSRRSSEGESSIYIDPLATDASPHVDLLGSAERMDSSYHQVIGDFVENIRHEESTSVIEMEKKLPKRQLPSEEVGFTHEESVQSDSGNGNMMKEVSRYSFGSGTGTDPLATDASPHVDLLGSAERMDNIYHQVIDNFVENIRLEESTSVIEVEKKLPKRKLISEGYTHEESVHSDSEKGKLMKERSRCSSGSGMGKEHTDKTLTLQQPPERESSENAETPRNGLAKRSGRALWNVAANIVRLRWGVLAESHKSNVKSGGQSSLSDSTGSESLFSGYYPNDAQGGNMDLGTLRTPLEPSFTHQPLLALNMGDNSVPSPSFGGVSGETNIELNVDGMSSQATASMDWTQSAGKQFRRSHRRSDAIYELQEGGIEATGSGGVDRIKGDLDSSVTVVSGSEKNVVELQRRNLLRSNQVMKERFDEWGEAYMMESEQRKIDQTFMREALEEAKKAADAWEFPVGAILVQDRKIIARGHNLVEDSRDSTAHAEIVCIREASSILKTWRLSDTALYVTLEPCAMCAGAILQARVGTLVYGAPNKLVGADGSWVRLFPGSSSVDGEGGSESTTKTEGPVHPFHPKMVIRRGILEAECAELMQRSFKLRRKKDKKTEKPDEKRSNRKLLHPSKLLHKMHHMFLFC